MAERGARSRPLAWSADDLARRLSHALDIASQAVTRLAPKGFTDLQDPNLSLRPEKLISETAFLLLGASGAGHGDVVRKIRDVAEMLVPYARNERMVLGLCVEPALALDYAQPHIYLTRLGYPDPAFDAVLRRSLASLARGGRERPPHRAIEQEWLLEGWLGAESSRRGRQSAAVRQSVLSRPMDLLTGSREDVYAFTHALMYVTDFSIRPRRLPRPAAEILDEAEAALGRCLDEEDYDLGGEVLLAWPLNRKPWSAAAAFGFRVLARVEDEAGFLPSAGTRLERLNALSGDARSEYLLATAYHTAYVMGLLCAAALRTGKIPPQQIPARHGCQGAAASLLPFLENDARTPHWRDQFEKLQPVERDALASLLFAVGLRRCVGRRDFGRLQELLAFGSRLQLVEASVAAQAAQMLDRVAAAAPLLLKAPRVACT